MEYPFRLSQKQFSLLVVGLLVVIAGYVLFDFLVFEKVYLFPDTGGDSYLQFYPWLVMVSDYLYSQGLPTWSFKVGLGQNIFPADLNNPFRLFLVLLGEERLHLAIGYVELIKFALSGWLFYSFSRILGLQPLAAGIGAVLFANTGYLILGSSWHGHSAFVVFGIFYIFAFEKLFTEKVWVYFPIAVFLILSRSPFYLYFLSLFLALYTIIRLHGDKDTGWRFGSLVLTLCLCGGLGILLSAWFTLSDVHRILASPRLSGGVGYFDNLSAASVFQLATSEELLTSFYRTLSTDLLGTGDHFVGWYNYLEAPNFYAGIISLLLLPQFFFMKPNWRYIFLPLLGLALLVTLFPFFRYSLYLFSGNYYKGGLSFVIGFGLVLCSALVYSEILKGKRIHIPGLVLTAVLLLTLLFFPFEGMQGKVTDLRFLVAIFISVYVALLTSSRWHASAKFWIIAVIVVEAGLFSSITVNNRTPLATTEFASKEGYNDGSAGAIQRLRDQDSSVFRTEKFYNSIRGKAGSLNEAQVQNYFSTSSYYQFNHPAYIRFFTSMGHLGYPVTETSTRWVRTVADRPILQSLLGVKYILSETSLSEDGLDYVTEHSKVEAEPYVYLNDLWLPLAFVYDRHITVEEFYKLSPECHEPALLAAYVSESTTKQSVEALRKCPDLETFHRSIQQKRQNGLKISEFSEARLIGDVQLDEAGVLFFSIPFDIGWQIEVNGKERQPIMVNFGFLALELEAGQYEVKLSYEPPSFRWGFVLSISALIIYLITAVLSSGSCKTLQNRFQG